MIKIFIESGVNAAQKKGSKRTTNNLILFDADTRKNGNPRHKGLIDCYRRYEKGISRMNRRHKMYMTQGRKGCIYSYIAAMKKDRTAQTEFSHGIWFF